MPLKIDINAIAYREGDAWVIQGIEYDIVAFAKDITALPDAFSRAVVENVCITQHLGREPLAGIKPAPQRFRDMYERAGVELRTVAQEPGRNLSVRVLEHAA